MIVWLASYPRSGNTFARTVLRHSFGQARIGSVYSQPSDPERDASWRELASHPDPDVLDELQRSDEPTFVKTHRLSDPADSSPAVYLVRDGRDAVSSYARFALAEGSGGFEGRSHEDAMETLIRNDDAEIGGWSTNVRSWTRRDAPTAVVRFEELIEDPIGALRAAAGSLGVSLQKTGKPPRSFDQLHEEAPMTFPRGKVGAWRTEMPARIEQLFWSIHGAEMLVLGYSRAHPATAEPAAV